MMQRNSFFATPPVVKNILLINVLLLLVTSLLGGPGQLGYKVIEYGALFPLSSRGFHLYQLVSYMFLHADFTHLFFNMFAVWMFGRILEQQMGSKNFLTFYMVCGVGAGIIQLIVNHFTGAMAITVGASGAVFGLLLAFGMMFPNSVIMLIIPPIPIKAKYFVIFYGLIELGAGVRGLSGGVIDNVAHFAHLGGMLWGFLLLYYWKKKGKLHF